MTPHRRFHSFNDDLRARFGDRLQRVTLSGGLVCPHPDGPDNCAYCTEAVRHDPGYGKGFPVHEQIRRGINFSRRNGTASPLVMVTIRNPRGTCAPADHLAATLDVVLAQEGVVVVTFAAPVSCITDSIRDLIKSRSSAEREVWIEFESLPEEWPVSRDPSIHFGVMVRLNGAAAEASASDTATVATLVRLLPDSIGFVPPTILAGTADGVRYEEGELDEPELEPYASRVASVLERIPSSIAIVPLVLPERADLVLGPRWAHNRQKVQEAIAVALEEKDSRQGGTLNEPARRASSEDGS